jgi:hypothetical protein
MCDVGGGATVGRIPERIPGTSAVPYGCIFVSGLIITLFAGAGSKQAPIHNQYKLIAGFVHSSGFGTCSYIGPALTLKQIS